MWTILLSFFSEFVFSPNQTKIETLQTLQLLSETDIFGYPGQLHHVSSTRETDPAMTGLPDSKSLRPAARNLETLLFQAHARVFKHLSSQEMNLSYSWGLLGLRASGSTDCIKALAHLAALNLWNLRVCSPRSVCLSGLPRATDPENKKFLVCAGSLPCIQ